MYRNTLLRSVGFGLLLLSATACGPSPAPGLISPINMTIGCSAVLLVQLSSGCSDR